ncbi:MAG: hypothetical protein UX09_C0023G0008 [Candidatus Uhrbacteria bacterium GW2011_GWE2_45_35]|uniref:DUF4878 domain-containing protein n=2 Tax=Candidatus Uhriibacteriota TaxID=1752732 RepID=A0A0G1JH32_9BACT|nr:MAG: hypothetical protein UW63_C0023G0009 [Candidatus Uhrbacteria bacterium GW2011_GWF2_44_350]KKU07868.1 MAG: hypothetical protein UX09_C0023G0008 [Candidatus Uhrbacteria bacterium GW2011_GWE2_45_35]HBR80541.1 hypothetical protein [Candidatus Uhrbacteria bacterium]HCU31691.1 hypothetical protein [Candidatus Uhrbacteria bacterium]
MEQENSKKKFPTWLKVVIGLVIAGFIGFVALFAVIFGTAWNLTAAPVKSAELFLDFASHEIYDSMYAYTSPTLQKVTSEEGLIALVESYPVLTDMEKVSFSNRSIDNDLATVYGTIYGAGTSSPIYIELEKVDDDWLVSYISLNEEDIPVEE